MQLGITQPILLVHWTTYVGCSMLVQLVEMYNKQI